MWFKISNSFDTVRNFFYKATMLRYFFFNPAEKKSVQNHLPVLPTHLSSWFGFSNSVTKRDRKTQKRLSTYFSLVQRNTYIVYYKLMIKYIKIDKIASKRILFFSKPSNLCLISKNKFFFDEGKKKVRREKGILLWKGKKVYIKK